MFKVGNKILTPDGRYGTIECVRKFSIVVRFADGWFRSYPIENVKKQSH